ncbi:hypothetical protein AA0498_2774 [Acidomonas methanolica]|uniref:Uncharacterized protein n=1 Tax=Acidomonas methanolica NBRC 104435 TaxID=1231351 RepID=A0A023D6F1_ACIMT|nr:hypothetical protein EDC31_12554 [Acidomonas methanolica]GAJ29712.1 hypothetical protein Amme_076_005 [Acidomonas methanolica NBRC 104435]GBQ59517.1 hypothetical protein AA0498_2774 [Acidomonas methanolica]GEL00049.1 hypothetical protein AME01nite_25470 [Acidomonas methanolica NBRC 104435]
MEEPIREPKPARKQEIDMSPILAETLVRLAQAWRITHPTVMPETREYLASLVLIEMGCKEVME